MSESIQERWGDEIKSESPFEQSSSSTLTVLPFPDSQDLLPDLTRSLRSSRLRTYKSRGYPGRHEDFSWMKMLPLSSVYETNALVNKKQWPQMPIAPSLSKTKCGLIKLSNWLVQGKNSNFCVFPSPPRNSTLIVYYILIWGVPPTQVQMTLVKL